MPDRDEFEARLAAIREAIARGVCVACRRPAEPATHSAWQEYHTSGLCQDCFEKSTRPPE